MADQDLKNKKQANKKNNGASRQGDNSDVSNVIGAQSPKNLIIEPVVSEKSYRLAREENQYIFKVRKEANKRQIAKAIQDLYKVSVVAVRIVNIKGKRVRFRSRKWGRRSDIKKAIVKLKEGDKITIFD